MLIKSVVIKPLKRQAVKMSDREIKNKVVVVTGGAGGIGLAIAEKFLQEGATAVVITDINETVGTKVAGELNAKYGSDKVLFIKGDVTKDLDEVYEKIVAKYKTVDVLVNNAGVADENNFRRTISINTIATVEWTMKFLEHMRKDKGGNGGTILNVASMYGFLVDPFMVYYKTSKYAVMGFTQTIGHPENFKVTGVRVVVLCPGFVHTNLPDDAQPMEALKFQKESYDKLLAASAWQETTDVARAAADVIKTAESGSAWMVQNAEEIQLVPQIHHEYKLH